MIGSFRNRITLLTESRIDDDAGGGDIVWLSGPEIWAEVTLLSSARDVLGERARRLKRIAATIRHRDDVELDNQIRFDNDNYEIVSIENDDEKARRLTLICEEVVS